MTTFTHTPRPPRTSDRDGCRHMNWFDSDLHTCCAYVDSGSKRATVDLRSAAANGLHVSASLPMTPDEMESLARALIDAAHFARSLQTASKTTEVPA